MEEKIKKELAEYGFSMDDLTNEELEELKQEIKLKEEGHVVLDGVLFSKPMYFKKITGVDSEWLDIQIDGSYYIHAFNALRFFICSKNQE